MQMRRGALCGRETFCEFMRQHKSKVAFSLTPDARIGLGRLLGLQGMGSALTETMLRAGVDAVLVANEGHSEMIKAQAAELLWHIQKGSTFPLILKACPKWKRAMALENPELLPYFSIVKPCYATSTVERSNAIQIMVVGCATQKAEGQKHFWRGQSSHQHVITARELANWLVHKGAVKQPYEPYIEPWGCGGPQGTLQRQGALRSNRLLEVIEAAMAQQQGCEINPADLRLAPSTCFAGVCEGSFEIAGKVIRVASARGADNANVMLREMKDQGLVYHLLEVLSCVGSDC